MTFNELLSKADALLAVSKINEAKPICERLIKDHCADALAMLSLGQICASHKMFYEARSCLYKAVGVEPENYGARYMLGHIHMAMEEWSEAVIQFTQALSIVPDSMEAHAPLGVSLSADGREEDAIEVYRHALSIDPGDIQCNYNLGLLLKECSQYSAAVIAFEKVQKKSPHLSEVHNSLGYVRRLMGDFDIAKECLEKAVELNPLYVEAYYNLGRVYLDKLRPGDALQKFFRVIDIRPEFSDAYWQMGNAYIAQGNYEQAERQYRKCLEIRPDHQAAHSNLLLVLHYNPEMSAEYIFREHRKWAARMESISEAEMSFQNSKDPERRLNIGYISPDFRAHSVAYFVEALLVRHDKEKFNVFVYSDVDSCDGVTQRFQDCVKNWRDISQETNEKVMSVMRKDKLDILIDLAGHTNCERTALIAKKPAPLVMGYLGYPDTIGLKSADYRITDDVADPLLCDQFYTESLIRLPSGFLCYTPPRDCPPILPAPCTKRGYFTFGSFNNIAKINSDVVRVWSDILHEVPNSRLLLKSKAFFEQSVSDRCREMFHAHGIADDRIEIKAWSLTNIQHMSLYSKVDLALDTFPYNGTTTTCEALWMGVPVITLTGYNHAGRVGTSILTNVGLGDLVARTPEEYTALASKMARDYTCCSGLRDELRDKIVKSSLGNQAQFTMSFEEALRDVWRNLCKGGAFVTGART